MEEEKKKRSETSSKENKETNKGEEQSVPFFGWLVKNVILAVIFFAVLIVGTNIFLNWRTRHGQTVEVPDFTNMNAREAEYNAGVEGLRVEVTDSVYVKKMGRGLVFSQSPKPGAKVKKNRKVRLVINSVQPKKVHMPNVVGLSMRQANSELVSKGLRLGKLIYVKDIATNNVMRQLYNNREISPGKQVESGSKIDLVVGLNPENDKTYIPDVRGLKYQRAIDVLHESSLNVGKVTFDKKVKTYADSLDAVVVKQTPEPPKKDERSKPVKMGKDVSLELSDGSISK